MARKWSAAAARATRKQSARRTTARRTIAETVARDEASRARRHAERLARLATERTAHR